jgi:hypothetical protein
MSAVPTENRRQTIFEDSYTFTGVEPCMCCEIIVFFYLRVIYKLIHSCSHYVGQAHYSMYAVT